MSSPLTPLSFGSSSSSFSPPLSRANSTHSSSSSSSSSLKLTPFHSPFTSPLPNPKPDHVLTKPSRNDIFGLSWNIPAPNLPTRPQIFPNFSQSITTSTTDSIDSSPLTATTPTTTTPQSALLSNSLRLRLSPTPPYFLGSGRHATVYAAAVSTQSDPSNWSLCAAKRAERGEESAAIRETQMLIRLSAGPHIIRLIGLVDEAFACSPTLVPNRLSLLLEYCSGGTLFDDVAERPRTIGRMIWIRWAIELTTAVSWCKDKRVLIGDLKPQNVLLTNKREIRLADFNRASVMGTDEPQRARAGTSAYAAPELVVAEGGRACWRSDVFALALTLWYALTGREPYANVSRPVERMVLVSRGAFWEHECRVREAAVGEYVGERRWGRRRREKISQVAIQALIGKNGRIQSDYSEHEEEEEAEEEEGLSGSFDYSSSLKARAAAATTTKTLERYSDGSLVIWFLDRQTMVDESILLLLKEMCDPVPSNRPEPIEILRRLRKFMV
ncbi:hypothetical protein CROQUDRAFT_651426 [Cronartium quercuum f. sp. fusiforme G11]|uniref:Protein kinase domain-containing protein n=1 Tax=Cronartium quercuum f. sp. fusiforme G11 TaxID=708437 RepID=A0A9P6THW9_9BASI|nr:hypothetical protein CROQUDRAFT_651426 [Cronartium quercuum f. sp. fusiforme G11]